MGFKGVQHEDEEVGDLGAGGRLELGLRLALTLDRRPYCQRRDYPEDMVQQ